MIRIGALLLSSMMLSVTGCAPSWSLQMSSFETAPDEVPQVRDLRPEEAKKFRYKDFAKVSYKFYLGDSNTTPNRIDALVIRAGVKGLNSSDVVEVHEFSILNDQSGSACKGCAFAAVSYSGAIGAESRRDGNHDLLTCELDASVNGNSFDAQAQIPYRIGPFDGPSSEPFAVAADRCVSMVIDRWFEMSESGSAESPAD